jgi:TonB family protein
MILQLIFDALWQGALVVGLTALLLRLVPPRNATTRYAAWFAAMLALIVIPLLSVTTHLSWHPFASLPQPAAARSGSFSLVPLAPLNVPSTQLSSVIAAVWIGGAALALLRLALSFARIARIRRRAAEIRRIDGIPILASSELSIPIATGVTCPAVVLPRDLVASLSESDLRCTIEHELAHLRRGDVATNAVARVTEAAFFWNPWVHGVGRSLVREREAACDDRAIGRLGEAAEYASCLAELAQRVVRKGSPLLTPSAFESRNALLARIDRLLSERSPKEWKLNYLAVGGIIMLFAAMTLAFQTLVPAPAQATALDPRATSGIVADASCKVPNAEPQALNPAAPDLPKSEWPSHRVSAVVVVKVGADGKPKGAAVYHSSGNANVDRAVIAAAEKSTYTPRMVNCVPESGSYLFRADFGP